MKVVKLLKQLLIRQVSNFHVSDRFRVIIQI